MRIFKKPARLKSKDKVAIVSPSSAVAGLFPWVYEYGLKRLREEFDLIPVEFPTARQTPKFLSEHPHLRAKDINDAFTDPNIKAIIATSGGLDEIRILPYLDANVISSNPKIFLGYSDNTNLHLYLYNLGIISYYGFSVMSQLAMQGKMYEFTKHFFSKAVFESNIGEIVDSDIWTDYDLDWNEKENLNKHRPTEKSPGWLWKNFQGQTIEGRLFGGCLEILFTNFAVNKYLPKAYTFNELVLYVETSEEMPSAGIVYHFFSILGERGILKKIKALLVAIPKTQFIFNIPPEGRINFMVNQQNYILKALEDYGVSNLPVIFNLHFGHVDPQFIIPNGSFVKIDSHQQKIYFE